MVVGLLHRLSGLSDPTSQPIVQLAMRGAQRVLHRGPAQKAPLTAAHLHLMFAKLDMRNSADLAFWSATLMAWWGMLRKASIVPPSVRRFDPSRHLTSKNLVALPGGDGVLVRQWFSKTNQVGRRVHSTVLRCLRSKFLCDSLCPVCALRRHLCRNRPTGQTPLSSHADGSFTACTFSVY